MDPFKLPWWSSDGRLLPSIRKDIHAYLLFPVHLFRRMLKEPIPPELDLRIMPQWLQTHLPAHHLLVAQVPGLSCVFSLPLFLPARPPLSIFTSVPHSLVCLVFALHSSSSCIHMLLLQAQHFFALGFSAQSQRKNS